MPGRGVGRLRGGRRRRGSLWGRRYRDASPGFLRRGLCGRLLLLPGRDRRGGRRCLYRGRNDRKRTRRAWRRLVGRPRGGRLLTRLGWHIWGRAPRRRGGVG